MDHYPVKRRGVPRRLNPNTEGINRLEEDTLDDTDIYSEQVFEDDGIKYTRAYGRHNRDYSRPMFQIIPNGGFSGMGPSVTPCQCDRFDQSWACKEHPEVDWDPVRRRWKRPCTGDRARCDCDPCHERRRAAERSRWYASTGSAGLMPPSSLTEAYQRQTAPLQEAGSLARRFYENSQGLVSRDPNQGRPGYHYDFAQDRWMPDTGDALADFRAGGEVGAGAYIQLDSVPEGLMGPTREGWLERLRELGDFTMTLEGTWTPGPRTLEIHCETEQGAGPLQIEVEPNDRSDA